MDDPDGVLPRVQDMANDFVYSNPVLHLRKDERPVAAHLAGITSHYFQIGSNRLG